ncbi:MAG: GNAT family N-acetyltransferase [Anaerolineae bacterium]|nr:GNAT family N-acetyltransferase [Anaerolineae bacterium]
MTGDRAVIRLARVDDAERVAELATQLGYPTTSEQMRRRLAQVGRAEEHAVYVAVRDGRVVGWIHVCARPLVQVDRAAEIEGLVVDEACRGRGIGRLLVRQIEQWVREQGCSTIYVRSNIIREGAHVFYQSLGYENIKTSLTFRKRLGYDG